MTKYFNNFLYLIWKINPGFDSDILVISMVLDEFKLPKHSEKFMNKFFLKQLNWSDNSQFEDLYFLRL